MRDLATQAGLVLRNVRLIEDLRASRQRLVAAQDAERRKLERNIHDGVQQQLVALNVQLGLLAETARRTRPGESHARWRRRCRRRRTSTLEDLRDLARGIYPPLLADQGPRRRARVAGAQGRRCPRRSTRTVSAATAPGHRGRRLLQRARGDEQRGEVRGSRRDATITLAQRNGSLEFTVRDDGRGFDPAVTTHGTGLQGIVDRLDAIGGSMRVESAPGAGTTLVGVVSAGGDHVSSPRGPRLALADLGAAARPRRRGARADDPQRVVRRIRGGRAADDARVRHGRRVRRGEGARAIRSAG